MVKHVILHCSDEEICIRLTKRLSTLPDVETRTASSIEKLREEINNLRPHLVITYEGDETIVDFREDFTIDDIPICRISDHENFLDQVNFFLYAS